MTTVQKTAIPTVVTSVPDPVANRLLSAIKQNVECITGIMPGVPVLTQLPATATTAQIIATLNAIIQRLNYQGQ
jgi:ABC-type uncharacterized transport system substrate-binding protein